MKQIQENIDITHLSNYKTPAHARFYFEISNMSDVEDVFDILTWAQKNKKKVLWISGGTNMLFAFDIFDGLVIKNSLVWWNYDQDTKILETYWSESIWEIAEILEHDYDQDLWHRFIGLPWSIAGAVYGNAGCFWLETENNFISCEVLDINSGQKKILYKDEMNFRYRTSLLKTTKKYFLISAKFDLSQKVEKYHSDVDNIDFRENKQPKWNSCGSFFKNPSRDHSAGYLIEQVGLKWEKLWWAYFSSKHANFLMHDWDGTYKDLLELMKRAQNRVKEEFNILLENEVQIITN